MIFTVKRPAWKGGLFLLCLAATAFLVAGVWLIFRSALPGIVHFDDIGNLSGLPAIIDPFSAWRWIQDGRAGPFGRPLALATFAVQYYEWPRPEAFLKWNIALHTINALLVFWLVVLVTCRMKKPERQQVIIGFCVAFTWAALPFLNTSVLFLIQRMALLSSTFMLAGLIGYLKCRGILRAPWPRQFSAMMVLAGFGSLAVLAKENGALIVVYALVLELGLLVIARERRLTLAAVLLILGCGLLLMGLVPRAFWDSCSELMRGFNLTQRLGSQGVMLLVYLKGLFLPSIADFNPFRFEFFLRDKPNLEWGVAIWLLLMMSPVLAWWRGNVSANGWRFVALALAWFFYGQIMESGWLNLEPYFAHRNYLPTVGLVFALVYGVSTMRRGAKLGRGVLAVYMAVMASLTWMNTSLWGDRVLAAEVWAMEQPRSVRAALNLAYSLESSRGLEMAQQHLDYFVAEKRDSVGLRLQGLVSACMLDPHTDHTKQLYMVNRAIEELPYEGWATDILEKLMDIARTGECRGVSFDQVGMIAANFLGQPAYQCSPPTVHNMLMLIGSVAMEHGDVRQAMDFYLKGLKESVSYSMAVFYFDLALQQGDRTAIQKLQALLRSDHIPQGTTHAEWQELQKRIDEQLRVGVQDERTDAR